MFGAGRASESAETSIGGHRRRRGVPCRGFEDASAARPPGYFMHPWYKMPPRRSGRRSAPRKGRKTYGRRKQPTTLINRSLTPFASRFITRMKFSQIALFSTTNGYTQVMNLNSVYDPNRTGIGHQPYGFDQLSAIYNRYRVIACSYVVHAYNGTTPIRFGVLPSNEIPAIGDMNEVCENPRSRFAIQLPNGSTQAVKGSVSIPALMGRTKAQYMADDRFQAAVTANPAELALLNIYAQSLANVNVDVNVTVTLQYTVEFFDPHPIDQS